MLICDWISPCLTPLQARRLHRLPHRLDYTLIPAPLGKLRLVHFTRTMVKLFQDLSLPLITEKALLPAIIVTPSSPSSAHDFSIAFLAPPPKLTLRERLLSYATFDGAFSLRVRTLTILFLMLFILVCHVVTHRLAARRPYLEFAVVQANNVHIGSGSTFHDWLDLNAFWSSPADNKRDFVITESTSF